MARRRIVWHAILFAAALGVMAAIFVYTTGAGTIIFRSVWRWIAYAARWVWFFLQRVMLRLVTRFATKPIWKITGLTAVTAYLSRVAKKHITPRASRYTERCKKIWRGCPWYVKGAALLGCVLTAIFFGVGLWLLPFGVPFYTKIAAKAQVMWTNSWLHARTRSLQMRWRCFLRRKQHIFCFRWVRASRHFIIKRERKTLAWTEQKYTAGAEWVKQRLEASAAS